jgi:hypothetical protein
MPAMRKATIACIVEGHGEVQAQAAFTAVFDMKAAREKSPSFDNSGGKPNGCSVADDEGTR